MNRLYGVLVFLVAWLGFFPGADASSLSPEPVGLRVRKAHRVVRAKVLGSSVQNGGGDPRRIVTVSRIQVLETLKGPEARELEIVQLGGKQGLWELKVAGDAQLVVGEESVFFLRCADQAQPDRCTLLALQEGRVLLVNGAVGETRDVIVPREGRKTWLKFAEEVRANAEGEGDQPPSPKTPAPTTPPLECWAGPQTSGDHR